MQYYRRILVKTDVGAGWGFWLLFVMQTANGSSNSLLKVMATYICLLVLCAQSLSWSCLHLGASVSGRHTGSSHAYVILKSQETVDGVSLFTVRPSS